MEVPIPMSRTVSTWKGILLYGTVSKRMHEMPSTLHSELIVFFLCCLVSADKKTTAEHAAAARAYDCWCLRLEGKESEFLGNDPPYLAADDAPSLPSYLLPADLREKLFQLQEDAKTRMPVPTILNPVPPMQTEEEAVKDRDEYRAARSSQKPTDMDEEW